MINNIIINSKTWYFIKVRFDLITERIDKVLSMDYQTLEQPHMLNMFQKANNATGGNNNGVEGMMHCMTRMGAHIQVDGRVAVVEGVSALQGATVACTDLRGGAALVLAGLQAQGRHLLGAVLGGAADDFGDVTDDLGHGKPSFWLPVQPVYHEKKQK